MASPCRRSFATSATNNSPTSGDKPVPHQFVLDAIAPLSPETRSMFGCLAVYVQDTIVLVLRDKRDGTADNGVWLATTEEHHQSLRREFPNLRSIQVFGKKVTGWQVLPARGATLRERHFLATSRLLGRMSSTKIRCCVLGCCNVNTAVNEG